MKKLLFLFLFAAMNANAQRNVILIIADDLGTDYCGFYEDHADTAAMPNIRRLLNNGIRFNNAMSNPFCSPTRAGVLTGRYSFRTGVGDVIAGINSATLDTSEISIPRLLKSYNPQIATANIGKWHLHQQTPASNLYIPNLMGYDHYAGNFLGALGSFTNWTKITNGVTSTSTNYATTETANDAIDWIRLQNTNPFFLWLAFNAPHSPYHLPPAGLHSYTSLSGAPADINQQPKEYFKASLEALDHEIGRLFDSLIVFNKMDSTDIIFIGDNGNSIRTAQIADSSRAKGTIYQYGVHVPFIISGPSIVNPGRISNALINVHDLFSTTVELFGYNNWPSQIPGTTTIDSKSILPIIKNQISTIRPWAFTELFKIAADSSDGKAMRNEEYKLLNFDYGHQEFYNLLNDSMELNDLLTGTLSSNDIANYIYLCNEMTTLVGSGTFCNSTVGANENTNQPVTVYPNPFTQHTTMVFNTVQDNALLSIIDVNGKTIRASYFSGQELIIERDALPVGINFLKVSSEDNPTLYKKILVQ